MSVVSIFPPPHSTVTHLRPYDIGRAATLALYDELELAPKPGLVSFEDAGSHRDMDARTFVRSIFALRGYFLQMAWLGAQASTFSRLEARGLEAETRMYKATGGVNTHRGAIFMLGLLCAAAGSASGSTSSITANEVRQHLISRWGDDLRRRTSRTSNLPGGIAARKFNLRSASEEAALGFPVLFEYVWPELDTSLQSGLKSKEARLNAFFRSMAMLEDSNLAARGGVEGLRFGQATAKKYLSAGGASSASALQVARQAHRDFVARNLSAGGSADTLAAACFLSRLLAF